MNKQKRGVSVRCPHCEKDQRLEKVRNYTCVRCQQKVDFFDPDGTVKVDVKYYTCQACGEKNFVGILTCTGCGLANPGGIP